MSDPLPEFGVRMVEDLTEFGEESRPRFLYFTRLDLEHVGVVAKFEYADTSGGGAEVYAVDEVVPLPGWSGRHFVLRKIGQGAGSARDCFVGTLGHRHCTCDGFAFRPRCRHVRMCEAVIRNGWLPGAAVAVDVPRRKARAT